MPGVKIKMSLKMLVVDDDAEVLKVIKALIEQLGIEVQAVANSEEAAQRVLAHKFDGVLLDAAMPDLDGFGLSKIVRSSPSNSRVPIVMLTGSTDIETMRKAYKAGITFFLNKPISVERMSNLVRAVRGPMLKERRRNARLPLRASVTCRWGNRQFKTETVNISEGGLLLETSGGTTVGQEFIVELNIPQAPQPLKSKVKVARKEPPDRLGVQFVNLEPRYREAIQAYIKGEIKS